MVAELECRVIENWLEADGRRVLTTCNSVPFVVYRLSSTVDALKPGESLVFDGEFNVVAPGVIDEMLEA